MPANFETDDLRFVTGHPADLLNSELNWADVQTARSAHYRRVFRQRSAKELSEFIRGENQRFFCDPQLAVGVTARKGQRRVKPRVVAAFDQNNVLRGLAHGAINVSSQKSPEIVAKAERFAKLHFPVERFRASRYIWGSEVIDRDGRHGLGILLMTMFLETAHEQPGSWYPYTEEAEVKELLSVATYQPDRAEDGSIAFTEELRFGNHPGAVPARQERWAIPRTGTGRDKLLDVPGAAEAYVRAAESWESL